VEFIAQHPVLVVSIVKIAVLLFIVLTVLAYLSWFERKVIAHIQARVGPQFVGAHGLLQPLADGLKFLFKEDVTPGSSDQFIFRLAPFLALTLALTTLALIPFGPATIDILGQQTHLVIANTNLGLLFIFAITSMGVYGVALAGWSSNSKYPLLGGLRSSAQMISYEVSLTLCVVGVLLLANSFDFTTIINSQQGYWFHFIPRWNFFPQIVAAFCYFLSAVAETNRAPFDLPEAEAELVAGFNTEYSSFKFAMFFMAEYANMLTVSCLASILFFGGWLSPLPNGWSWQMYLPGAGLILGGLALIAEFILNKRLKPIARLQLFVVICIALGLGAFSLLPFVRPVIQGPFWLLLKVGILMFVYVWARATLPRFRYDQLMSFGWKLLLPLSLANLVVTALVVVLMRHP
jgi:NADH-quinone oxidoreductase subunit H